MAWGTYMVRATLIHSNKFFIKHEILDLEAVVELKIWEFPETANYPLGVRFSLFCIDKVMGEIIVGFDNHHPKGPHKHIRGKELDYLFSDYEKLVDDFYEEIRKEGYDL